MCEILSRLFLLFSHAVLDENEGAGVSSQEPPDSTYYYLFCPTCLVATSPAYLLTVAIFVFCYWDVVALSTYYKRD